MRKAYDAIICCAGYETRARYAISTLSPAAKYKVVLVFEGDKSDNLVTNREFFETAGYRLIPAVPSQIDIVLKDVVQNVNALQKDDLSLCVDISSMNRKLIAQAVYSAAEVADQVGRSLTVDFLYSLAEYSDPGAPGRPICHRGPVIPEFAGWSDQPGDPCVAIVGIGYEADLALGTIEELEASEIWAFRPTGHDPRYDIAIDEANKGLFDLIPSGHIFKYSITEIFELFLHLESLVAGTLQSERPVLIPLGLKMFALCSFFVALQHFPNVAVWRVSAGQFAEPVDRIPSGAIQVITGHFSSRSSR